MLMKSRFSPEPEHRHGERSRIGILYCNLGTPDSPTPKALKRYLAQFLGDSRVVEIPRLLWLAILHGVILQVRPAKSAKKYASIWTDQGSPLKVWTQLQADQLQKTFDASSVVVRFAMTYGQPSIESQLDELKKQGCTKILILPAYPQYSGTTTASIYDHVSLWTSRIRTIPELRFVNHYHDHPLYIQALADSIQMHWKAHGRNQLLIMSFHGVPLRTLQLGDPYFCECHKTGRLLAEALGLNQDEFKICFQSRFGKAQWLQPYTEPTVRQLAQQGVKSMDVVCPGFTSDCLETLEEIAMEVKEAFEEEGGEHYSYIACLNDSDTWIKALNQIAQQHLQGWNLTENPIDLEKSRESAIQLGAPQ